ncbi:MAG: molybdate ABC transporter substrate-binding protein [Woeseia sp.]
MMRKLACTVTRRCRSPGCGNARACWRRCLAVSLLLFLPLLQACGERSRSAAVTVAVAANFFETAARVAADFEREYSQPVTLISASSGKLYAQISNGAPFDVFLSADEARALALEESGRAVQGSGFTYALGRLTLWSPDPTFVLENGAQLLTAGNIRRLAIANPALAPYGIAARETLQSLGLWIALQERIVMGENVSQAFSMVATGNADAGLLALATVTSPANRLSGSRWDVPVNLYQPIRQRAVLLQHGAGSEGAQQFLEFLRAPATQALIRDAGYDTE